MDKKLLQKYFRNQCSIEEIEQVLNWYQTEQGQLYIEEHLDVDMHKYAEEGNMLFYPDVPTEKMLKNIKRGKRSSYQRKNRSNWKVRISVAVIICSLLSGLSYYFLLYSGHTYEQEPSINYRTISTQNDQHQVVMLSDSTKIRLNSNTSIKFQENFPASERSIALNGEAWFEVAYDKSRPFSIQANQANIQVLGTKFNVKSDTLARNVQVAVAEGMVTLNSETNENGTAAKLTKNTFAVLNLDNNEILIENTPVENYLSWINGRLYFYNEPLWVVSRYLERLYSVSFQFEKESLKSLSLSTDMAKQDLTQVLDIISRTLSIEFLYEKDTVQWTTKPSNKP